MMDYSIANIATAGLRSQRTVVICT